MNRQTFFFVFLCMLGAGFGCSGHAAENEYSGITAHISVPEILQQGEPLTVTILVSNMTDKAACILVPASRRFGPDTVLFRLVSPGSSDPKSIKDADIYVGGLKSKPPSLLSLRRLDPGETAQYQFSLFYDFPDEVDYVMLFDVPGGYKISATVYTLVSDPGKEASGVKLDVERKATETNVAKFRVVAAENPDQELAYKDMLSLPGAYLLYAPAVFNAEIHAAVVADMHAFFVKHRERPLGQRAAIVLGFAVSSDVIKDDNGQIKAALKKIADCKAAWLAEAAAQVLHTLE